MAEHVGPIQVHTDFGAGQKFRDGVDTPSRALCQQWRWMHHVTGMTCAEIGDEDGYDAGTVNRHVNGKCVHGED